MLLESKLSRKLLNTDELNPRYLKMKSNAPCLWARHRSTMRPLSCSTGTFILVYLCLVLTSPVYIFKYSPTSKNLVGFEFYLVCLTPLADDAELNVLFLEILFDFAFLFLVFCSRMNIAYFYILTYKDR